MNGGGEGDGISVDEWLTDGDRGEATTAEATGVDEPVVIPDPPTPPMALEPEIDSAAAESTDASTTTPADPTDDDTTEAAGPTVDPNTTTADPTDDDTTEAAGPTVDPNATTAVPAIRLDPPEPTALAGGETTAESPGSDHDPGDEAGPAEAGTNDATTHDVGPSDDDIESGVVAAEDTTDGDAPAGTDASTGTTEAGSDTADTADPSGDSTDEATAAGGSLTNETDEPEGSQESGGTSADATAELPAGQAPATDPTAPMPTPVTPPAETSTGTSRSGRRVALILVGAVVGLYLLVAAAWAVDAASHRDRAMRGVHIDDIDVGGDDREELGDAIATLTDRLSDEDLVVSVGSTSITTDPVALGTIPESDAIIDEALAARRGGFLPLRPLTWAAGLFSRHTIAATYAVDPVVTRRGVAEVVAPELEAPTEPTMTFNGRELGLVAGASGVTVDAETVIDELPATIAAGPPYQLEVPDLDAPPELSDESVEDLAAELNEQTSEPITVRVLDKEVTVSPNSQRSWIVFDGSDGEAAWTIDEAAALDELQPLFPVLGSEDQQARFEVIDEEPIIIPAAETVVCCAEGAAEVLAETIAAPFPVTQDTDEEGEEDPAGEEEEAEPELRLAELEPEITGFDEGVAELETLGIVELVSTFTTEHACCENRVKNIQRFADLTQGAIIRPARTSPSTGSSVAEPGRTASSRPGPSPRETSRTRSGAASASTPPRSSTHRSMPASSSSSTSRTRSTSPATPGGGKPRSPGPAPISTYATTPPTGSWSGTSTPRPRSPCRSIRPSTSRWRTWSAGAPPTVSAASTSLPG